MLVNSALTVYHKGFDEETRLETWTRFNYGDNETSKVWVYGGEGASTNKGYENANNVEIRIPYDINEELDVKNFAIGDIVVGRYIEEDIEAQQDLGQNEIFNITAIVDNKFGKNKHIHLSGK